MRTHTLVALSFVTLNACTDVPASDAGLDATVLDSALDANTPDSSAPVTDGSLDAPSMDAHDAGIPDASD